MSKLKVFFALNESGVNYWRGKVPAKALQKHNLCDVKVLNLYKHTGSEVEEMLLGSDVIYMASPCGIDCTLEYIKFYQLGKAGVCDFDDNLFDCHPLNPGYSTLGLNEVTIALPDGSKEILWKDQRMGFSLKDNAKRFCSFIDILYVANTVTTTTKYLRDELSDASAKDKDDFIILPNSIDFNTFKPFQRRLDHSKFRIGWTASDSHLLEGRMVMDIIKELSKRRSDFQFVILGNIEKFRVVSKDLPIEWHEFVDLSIYPIKLASLELDLGICPLENHSFNKSKSALKWTEYSALGIPSVCSDIEPYKIITDGVDGMLAGSTAEFVDKICEIMDNSKTRQDIIRNSYEHNFDKYNIDKNCHKWLETFERAYFKEPQRQLTYKGKPLERIGEKIEKVS